MVQLHGIPPRLLLALAAALLLAGCPDDGLDAGGDGVTAARPSVEGPVVVVSTLDPEPAEALWKELRRQVRRLDLQVETVADEELATRVAAGGLDLVISARTGPIEAVAADGLLAPLPEQLTFGLPDARIGVDHRWIAIGLRARVIAIRRIVANKPRYVSDLSDARFRGRVARSLPRGDGFLTTVATLMADRANTIPPAFLRGLAGNSGETVLEDDPTTLAAIVGGQAQLALVDHTVFFRHIIGETIGGPLAGQAVAEASLEAIFPDSDGTGAAWSATGAGIVSGASNADGALVLLGVLLSAEAQRAWSDASLEYPAVEGVSAATGLPPASQVVWSETSLTELASLRAGALRYIEELENPRPEVPNPSPPEPDEASPDADKATD
jgi:iron(III) transport system substrate-binding protein